MTVRILRGFFRKIPNGTRALGPRAPHITWLRLTNIYVNGGLANESTRFQIQVHNNINNPPKPTRNILVSLTLSCRSSKVPSVQFIKDVEEKLLILFCVERYPLGPVMGSINKVNKHIYALVGRVFNCRIGWWTRSRHYSNKGR